MKPHAGDMMGTTKPGLHERRYVIETYDYGVLFVECHIERVGGFSPVLFATNGEWNYWTDKHLAIVEDQG